MHFIFPLNLHDLFILSDPLLSSPLLLVLVLIKCPAINHSKFNSSASGPFLDHHYEKGRDRLSFDPPANPQTVKPVGSRLSFSAASPW